jgi:lipopolysaccharide export system protein LptA
MMQKALALAAAAAVFSAAAPAHAQLSDSEGPISYSAAQLQYFDNERRLVLSGDVDIVQDDARLRASEVTLYFAQGGGQGQALASGDIQRMIASGDVYYVRPSEQVRGDRAVYETSSDTVTFNGNVIMASADSVLRGEQMVLRVKGGTAAVSPGTGQRVQGMIRPRDSAAPPAAPAPRAQ